jgi:hypothetical protein
MMKSASVKIPLHFIRIEFRIRVIPFHVKLRLSDRDQLQPLVLSIGVFPNPWAEIGVHMIKINRLLFYVRNTIPALASSPQQGTQFSARVGLELSCIAKIDTGSSGLSSHSSALVPLDDA